MISKQVKKIVFAYASETCPAVDSWFDYLIDEMVQRYGGEDEDAIAHITECVDYCRERVKADGTILLREAMYEMASHIISLEDRASAAEALNGN